MIFDKKIEYSKLRFKWRELNQELTDIKEIEKIAMSEFFESAMKYVDKYGLDDPFTSKKDDGKKGNMEVFQEDETKYIFRQAAIKSHPDKSGEEFLDVFRGISNAKKEGNLNQFLEEARKVKVKPDEISINQINVLEEEVYELEEKINEIRSSIHWIWYHETNVKKQMILEHILDIKNAKKKEQPSKNRM